MAANGDIEKGMPRERLDSQASLVLENTGHSSLCIIAIVASAVVSVAIVGYGIYATQRSNVNVTDISQIETVPTGEPNTKSYAVRFQCAGMAISPWHDIPLYADKAKNHFNFICEIPKGTAKKFEISRTIRGNPIIQDTNKDGSLRSYQWPPTKIDPKGPRMMWNYGALPQTWEDPSHAETDITVDGKHPGGDNDPIDVIEMGANPMKVGEIASVKILCVLALVDSGETDWKLLVARTDDPEFKDINTLEDLQNSSYYGEVAKIRAWLENYKMPTKNRKNKFGFDGKEQDEKYAISKIELTNQLWIKNTDSGRKNRELDN